MLADEVQVVASKAADQGVIVVSEQWESMPHCFLLVLLGSRMSRQGYQNWAAFCQASVGGENIRTRGLWIEAKTGNEREVEVRNLSKISDQEVRERMEAAKTARYLGDEGEGKMVPKL